MVLNLPTSSPKIAIVGASGFMGRALLPEILKKFPSAEIFALSRTKILTHHSNVHWVACDLFSLRSIQEALPAQVDAVIYLVHSMGPTAQLDQGSFADYDLILIDNFARAMQTREVKQVIYLGGLIPSGTNLSLHLKSRLEMEETLFQYKLPVTVFRSGLILGEDGSSFQILIKLVKRLPIMLCPKWTQTLTSPVDVETVVQQITGSILESQHIGKTYDLSACPPLTYVEMMKETARSMGLKRYFLAVPFFTPTLSRLWVSLISNSPKSLVYPLVESLRSPMLARIDHAFPNRTVQKNYRELISTVSLKTKSAQSIFRFRPLRKTVRSVQRLPLPVGKSAGWVRDQYILWLPKFLSPFIKVRIEGDVVQFCIFSHSWVLLELSNSFQASSSARQLLYIVKGILVSERDRGRLEFREVLNGKYVLVAIHDYSPSLPWFIYRFTQAYMHLFVMNAFRKHLVKMQSEQDSSAA